MILKILQRVSIHTLHDYCLGFFPERSSGEKLISQFVVRSFHLLPLPEPLLPRRLLVLGVHIFARVGLDHFVTPWSLQYWKRITYLQCTFDCLCPGCSIFARKLVGLVF